MTEHEPCRVLVADDHPVVRMGLAGMVAARTDLRLVGQADCGEAAVEQYLTLRPDVVLMDLRMPGLDGVAAIEAIRAQDPFARIIILTTFDGEEDIYRGLRAGAKAYLLKDAPDEQIVDCIRTVMRGQRFLPGPVALKLAGRLDGEALSRRELEVLRHLVTGMSNKEIARVTSITEGTVKFHVTAVMAKLNVKSRTEAVAVALRRRLISLD
ncbi:MAG: response regulator transcription factor [Chitinophagaceae bacterium]|nr:response regulator transcription factor [Rubrivivax sp.]